MALLAAPWTALVAGCAHPPRGGLSPTSVARRAPDEPQRASDAASSRGDRPPPPREEALHAATQPSAGTSTDALLDEVAELRGLRPTAPIAIVRLDDATFDRRVARATRGRATPYLGLYDFHSHELLVRSALDARAARGVLAHEMVHALQDQHFGLVGEAAHGEQALALKALYEGDATLLRERLAARDAGVDEATFLARAVLAVEALPSVEVARHLGAPASVLFARDDRRERVLFPYLRGFVFAFRLYERGGTRALDRAYADPPKTLHEVLVPDDYLGEHDHR